MKIPDDPTPALGRELPRVRLSAPDDELLGAMREIQYAILAHPVAAQAAFAALVAEGRRYARTPDGTAWKDRLSRSDLFHRARVVWDTVTMEQLSEQPRSILPSMFLDAFMQIARSREIEPLLTKLFRSQHEDSDAPAS